eukprot:11378801-Alexandrium_andersonii.AAC.1
MRATYRRNSSRRASNARLANPRLCSAARRSWRRLIPLSWLCWASWLQQNCMTRCQTALDNITRAAPTSELRNEAAQLRTGAIEATTSRRISAKRVPQSPYCEGGHLNNVANLGARERVGMLM